MSGIIRKKNAGEAWETVVDDGGGGGSQNLAQVLAVGGDPDGNPITGAVVVDTGGADGPTFAASTDFNGDGLGSYVSQVGGDTVVAHYGTRVRLGDSQFRDVVVAGDNGVNETLGFFDKTAAPGTQPVVPLTAPSVQDVIDALVALGLVSQSD